MAQMIGRGLLITSLVLLAISRSSATSTCESPKSRISGVLALACDFKPGREPPVKYTLMDDEMNEYSVSMPGSRVLDRDLVLTQLSARKGKSFMQKSFQARQPYTAFINSSDLYYAVMRKKSNLTRTIAVDMSQDLHTKIDLSSLYPGPIEILHSFCILNTRNRTLGVYFRPLSQLSEVMLAIILQNQRVARNITSYDRFMKVKSNNRLPLFAVSLDKSERVGVVLYEDSTYAFTRLNVALTLKRIPAKTETIEWSSGGEFKEPIRALIKMKKQVGTGFSFLIATRGSFYVLDLMWVRSNYRVVVWPSLSQQIQEFYYNLIRSFETRMERMEKFIASGDMNTGYYLLSVNGQAGLQFISLIHGKEDDSSYLKSATSEWGSVIVPQLDAAGNIVDYIRYSYNIINNRVVVKHISFEKKGKVLRQAVLQTTVKYFKFLGPPKFIIPFKENFGFVIYSDASYSLTRIDNAIRLELPLKLVKFLTFCPQPVKKVAKKDSR